jgi:hypothetical protein
MKKQIFPYGFKHEVAKRWTPMDWLQSRKISSLIEIENSDNLIAEILELNRPALVGRLGGTEARFLGEYLKISRSRLPKNFLYQCKPNWKKRSFEVNNNAGFYYGNGIDIENFYNTYDVAIRDTDVLGSWGTAFAWIESMYVNEVKHFIPVDATAPWVESFSRSPNLKPWSAKLQNRNVLVVSPFAETIAEQHRKIQLVFDNFRYPKFNLKVLQAPLTTGHSPEKEPTWFDRLCAMKDQMSSINFDVALISAGAYSYPLAHFAKQSGKIGIHSGGGLQLFFGVMGKRWEKNWGNGNYYEGFVNENWTRPKLSETPKNAKSIEDGCYW